MDAIAICRRLTAGGMTYGARDGKFIVAPASRLTDDLRALIRERKPELLQLLADAHATAEDLVAWAMKTCDRHADGEAAREQMRRECLATPLHLRADLLAHFKRTNGGGA